MVRLLGLTFIILILSLAFALADSDFDGVEDEIDICPQTVLSSLVLLDADSANFAGCSCEEVRQLLIVRYGNHPDHDGGLNPCVVMRCDAEKDSLEVLFPQTSSEPIACPEDACDGNNLLVMKEYVFPQCQEAQLVPFEDIFKECVLRIDQNNELCNGRIVKKEQIQDSKPPANPTSSIITENQQSSKSDAEIERPKKSFNYWYLLVPFILFVGGFFVYFLFKPTDVRYN